MSRNYSERTSNGRSRQSSEKPIQAEPMSAPSAKPSFSPKPAAPAASQPQAAPAPRPCTATAVRCGASPTPEQVAERAKSIWMKSGCQPGRDKENWLEAERQLRQETNRR